MQSNLTIPKYLKSPSLSRDSSLIFNDNKTTTMHSRVQSALLTPSGLRASIMNSEFGFRSIPSSPKGPATMPMFPGKDEDQDVVSRAAKSTRLMRKISTFAKNPSVDFGVKAKTINAIEARKLQSYQSPRILSPKSPLNLLLQSHGNFLDHFVGKSPSNGATSLLAIKDELDLVEKKYSPMVIEHHKFIYFQIACHNMPSPLVINIVKGTTGTSNARLKVFVSKFNKRPSALSCDYTVESRNIKIYERDYKDTFDTTAYYFGIYSENKFEGKVMFFFGETLTAVKRERPQGISFNLKQNWKTRAQDVDPINADEIKQIKKELRKKRWVAGGCVNRVERNKSIKSPDDKQKELVEKRVLLESRSSDVFENKNKRESMKLQRKLFLAERHDIQKAVKDDERMRFEHKIAKMIFHRDWIQALVFPVLMKNLKKMYDEKREAFKRRQRIFLRIQLFAIRYRRKLQRKGPSLVDRLVFDIRGALELHVRSLTIVQKTEIQSVACKLFAEYALYANTMKSILRTHAILKKFSERWLLAKKRKQVFMKVVGMIWDKYHMGILSELSPSEIKKPDSNRSIDSEESLSILDRKLIKEEKKKRFVEYMVKYSYYKFNKNIHRFRMNFEDLEPKLKKTADYAKYFLLDRKKFIKNSLITKVENCDINAIFSHDINLSDPIYELYHKIDMIRPPRLFYIPKTRVVQKAVIALAKGDNEIKTMESLPEFIIYE